MEGRDRSAALVLASDADRSFAGPKYTARYRGSSLLQLVLADVAGWPVDEVVVVLGADAETVLEHTDFGSAMVLIDPEWKEGDAASLRVGLDALSRERSIGVGVLARGDQPGVPAGVVARLVGQCGSPDVLAVVPKYRYARGWPVAVAEALWPRLMSLEGTTDIHDVLASHPSGVVEARFDELAPLRIEAGDDLQR